MSRLFKISVCFMFLACITVGCGGGVDTSPAVGEGSGNPAGDSSIDDLSEAEAEEFEAGEEEAATDQPEEG